MIILGIETSCDETGVCLLKTNKNKISILSNLVFSQVRFHKKYGGVYPFLAKRLHEKNLPFLFQKSLKEAGVKKIDLVAVTVGPGLEPCLWQGFNFAKEIAQDQKIPLLGVNHIEAHVLINLFEKKSILKKSKKFFPALCLVISGGHTVLFLMEKIGKYIKIGQTRDDAVGECQDKIGRMLGFPYPAGPHITQFLIKFKKYKVKNKISLPRPMINQKNFDFSFSGLKTAVFYTIKDQKRISLDFKVALLKEFQRAITDVLILKTQRAIDHFKPKSLLLGGGVARDYFLRKAFKSLGKKKNLPVFIPKKENCTDNGLIIAWAGYLNFKNKVLSRIKIDAKKDI